MFKKGMGSVCSLSALHRETSLVEMAALPLHTSVQGAATSSDVMGQTLFRAVWVLRN